MAPVFNFQPTPAYKVSKAALNMLTVQYAQAFAEDGLVFVAVCPGASCSFIMLVSCTDEDDSG